MYLILAILCVALLSLVALRLWDERADRREWARLIASQAVDVKVEAANLFGTDEHFVFFKAMVSAVRFLQGEETQ